MEKEQKKIKKNFKVFIVAFFSLLSCFLFAFKLSNIKTVKAYESDYSDNGSYDYSPIIPFSNVSLYITAPGYEPVGYITPVFSNMSFRAPISTQLYKLFTSADGLNIEQYYSPFDNSFFIYFDCLGLLPNNIDYSATWEVSAYNFAMPRSLNEFDSNQLSQFSFLQHDTTKQQAASTHLIIDFYLPNDETLHHVNSSGYGIFSDGMNVYRMLWLTVPDAVYIERLTIHTVTWGGHGNNYRFVLNNGLVDSQILSGFNRMDLNNPIVTIDQIDWFEQIVRDVNAILSIEILPGVSFNDILLIAIAIPLAMWIVKMFVH